MEDLTARLDALTAAPYTSETIAQLHAPVYRRLFERCECVLSAPLAFRWTGDRASFRSVSRHQPLPRRVLIGIQRVGATA